MRAKGLVLTKEELSSTSHELGLPQVCFQYLTPSDPPGPSVGVGLGEC